MYLSKLEIIGFKSFATKTSLGFDSGISAIVGPNGCGKTNIVDAIRWVLGEQRYSALRSEKMEDVIFNGTKARKPLGMAEATLVIENTKGILPSEYSQVMIGRRVYRSGESEYLLNKVPCRLKDIQTLFMDTGMGADAYSVIELKMVESILSDRTDERRHLFEEAAGVTKYKHRRKAAFRKLENVQADLMRVNDIVSEVDKAVRTLERQANRAGQYNEVRDRLRTMEVDLMQREFAQLHGRRIPLEGRLEQMRGERTEIDGTLSRDEGRLDELRNQMNDLERRLAESQRDVSAQLELVGRVKQRNLVAAERRKGLEQTISRCRTEIAELHEELRTIEESKEALIERMGTLNTEERNVAGELEDARSTLRVLETKLAEKRGEMHSLSEMTIAAVHSIAEQQAEQDKRRARIENLQGRAARAMEEISAYEQEIIRLESEIERLQVEDKDLRRKFSEAEIRFYDTEKARNQLKAEEEQIHEEEIRLRTELEKQSAKKEFLEGLVESRDGISEGVRFLASSGAGSTSRLVTVADLAVADERYRPALEAALGESGNILVASSFADATRAIGRLKEAEKGKATFACLDRLPSYSVLPRVPEGSGVLGWASELVRCSSVHRPLFRFLLDRVLIVRDQKTAEEVTRSVAGVRCVTLAGEMLSGGGITRGGSRGRDEGGALGKQAQVDELRAAIGLLSEAVAGLQRGQAELRTRYDAIDLQAMRGEVKRVEKEMNAVEVRMAQLEFEKGRAGEIIVRNRGEIESLEQEGAALMNEIRAGAPSLEEALNEKTDIERRVGGLQLETGLLEKEENDRANAVGDLSVRTAKISGVLQSIANDLNRSNDRLDKINQRLIQLQNEIESSESLVAQSHTEVEEDARELNTLETELARFEERRSESEGELKASREEIHLIEMRIKDDRRVHDDSLKATHDLELRIADLRAKGDHIKARAFEEFELELELKEYPEDEFVDFAALRDQIQALRNKIRSLGNINFAAFEEYNTEKERLEFLTAQRADLVEAEKTLLSTIEEINTTAQNKFLETFAQIRANFIETFKSLFDPGDECDLRLEEGIDPLEAGIEIIAKPRGKRPTSIDLLSGGEKTLTATALLFAIYLVKPSPFCILDEVDAPLDDANIDRFTRILGKFSDNTQFIVVTHNKRTMESANALYGVTMEEEGVSKLVTVRFNKAGVAAAEMLSG